jgi:hypothetical protein
MNGIMSKQEDWGGFGGRSSGNAYSPYNNSNHNNNNNTLYGNGNGKQFAEDAPFMLNGLRPGELKMK